MRLVVTDDHGDLRAARIGPLHLRLEAPAAAVLEHREAMVAEPFRHGEGEAGSRLTLVDEVDVPRLAGIEGRAVSHQRDEPLDPHRESGARRGLAADLRTAAIVPAAAADGALCPEPAGDPLEAGQGVVVEPAYEVVVDRIGHGCVL